MHDSLINRVIAAPVNLFFDITPIGKLLNRFSSDLKFVKSTKFSEKIFSRFGICSKLLKVLYFAQNPVFMCIVSYSISKLDSFNEKTPRKYSNI